MDKASDRETSQDQGNDGSGHPSWMFWKKRRYFVGIMAFFGFFNIYALRVNLSIAIVAMTANRSITAEDGTVTYEKDFDWDSKTQGYVLSSFFYGYITTQLFGGWISAKRGGKMIFGVGIGVTAIMTLLTPLFASINVSMLITARIIEGVFEGVTYPCIHAVWARWAPPLERSRLSTLAFSGSYVGTVVAMPLSAQLANALGWSSIFYVFGAVALLWCALWTLFVAESPETDPSISAAEREYIKSRLGEGRPVRGHPWRRMLRSVPVWATIAAHFAETWGFYTLLTLLPKFMSDILHFDLGQTGFMAAMPYLAISIVTQFSGHCADWLLERNYLSTTQVRKLFNCGACIAQTIFMLAGAFWLSPVGTTVCLTLSVGLGGFAWSGWSVNYLDIAPQHASVLMGLGNTFGSLPGIISPILAGYIVQTPTEGEWQIVFYITSAIYVLGCVIYGIFASSELQPWAKDESSAEEMTGHVNGAHVKD